MMLYCFRLWFALVSATVTVADVSAANTFDVNAAVDPSRTTNTSIIYPLPSSIPSIQTSASTSALTTTSISSTSTSASTSTRSSRSPSAQTPTRTSSTSTSHEPLALPSTSAPKQPPSGSTSAPASKTTSASTLISKSAPASTSISASTLTSTSSPTSTYTSTSAPASTSTLASISELASASTSTSTLASTSAPNSSSFKTSNINGSAIAGGVAGCVVGGSLITVLVFWLYNKRKDSRRVTQMSTQTSGRSIQLSPASTIECVAHARPVSQLTRQEFFGPDDIPTSTTIPRTRDEKSEKQLPRTMGQYWGQVGQYYHGLGEV